MWVKNQHQHHYFCVFPGKCWVLGVQDEKKEVEGKGEGGRGRERGGGGEGGSRVLDMSDNQRCEPLPHGLRDDHGQSIVHIMVASRSRRSVKKVRFSAENSIFHELRTLMLEGPNLVRIFSHFMNITFSPKKRQGPNYVKSKPSFFGFSPD